MDLQQVLCGVSGIRQDAAEPLLLECAIQRKHTTSLLACGLAKTHVQQVSFLYQWYQGGCSRAHAI